MGQVFDAHGNPTSCRYQKALGRLREEKRAAKLLRAQLAEERGFVAETVLAKLGLPRVRCAASRWAALRCGPLLDCGASWGKGQTCAGAEGGTGRAICGQCV